VIRRAPEAGAKLQAIGGGIDRGAPKLRHRRMAGDPKTSADWLSAVPNRRLWMPASRMRRSRPFAALHSVDVSAPR
jgi:hypothetical protein